MDDLIDRISPSLKVATKETHQKLFSTLSYIPHFYPAKQLWHASVLVQDKIDIILL